MLDSDLLARTGSDFLHYHGTFLLSVSGGIDSMLLLYFFASLHKAKLLRNRPVVFHLDHRIRDDSDQDRQFVLNASRTIGLPCIQKTADCRRFAQRTGRGLEEAGRVLRYGTLRHILKRSHPDGIAVTAHHADDYVESVLLHLIRGGGSAAFTTLERMSRIESVPLFRPFVLLERETVEKLVREYDIPFREDPSNALSTFRRNRLRNSVLPLLKAEGLDAGNLWKNFHVMHEFDFERIPATTGDHPEWITLNRKLLFSGPVELKKLLDLILYRLGLHPCSRTHVEEIVRQLNECHGNVRFSTRFFSIRAARHGPVWIYRSDASLLRRAILTETVDGETGVSIRYANRVKIVRPDPDQEIGFRRDGMKMRFGEGSKKMKKVFQENGIPVDFRDCIPLIWNRETSLVERVLFSFFEEYRDIVAGG